MNSPAYSSYHVRVYLEKFFLIGTRLINSDVNIVAQYFEDKDIRRSSPKDYKMGMHFRIFVPLYTIVD